MLDFMKGPNEPQTVYGIPETFSKALKEMGP